MVTNQSILDLNLNLLSNVQYMIHVNYLGFTEEVMCTD